MRELSSQQVLLDLGADAIRFVLIVEAGRERYAFIEPSLFPVGLTLRSNGHHFPHLRGSAMYKYVNDQAQAIYLAAPTEGANLKEDGGSLLVKLAREDLNYWIRFSSSDEEGIPCRVSPLLQRNHSGGLFEDFDRQDLHARLEAAERNIDLRVTWVWKSGKVNEEEGSAHLDTLLSLWVGGAKAWTISIMDLADLGLIVTEPTAPAQPSSPYMPQKQGDVIDEAGS